MLLISSEYKPRMLLNILILQYRLWLFMYKEIMGLGYEHLRNVDVDPYFQMFFSFINPTLAFS